MIRATLLALTLGVSLLAAAPPETPAMDKIRLDIVPVLDVTPRRFVFVIGGVAYETEAGLRQHVEAMPKGSTIVLDPGCMRMGGEPLLDDAAAMASFKEHARKFGITVNVIPSG